SPSAAIGPRDTLTQWRAATSEVHLSGDGRGSRFGAPARAEFGHRQPRTVDSLVATLGTRAGMLVMPESERTATLERIRTFLIGRPETSGGFDRPLLTGVLRFGRDEGLSDHP